MVYSNRIDSNNSSLQGGNKIASPRLLNTPVDNTSVSASSSKANLREAVSLAINPLPVFHAPVRVNTEEIAKNLKDAIERINSVLKDGGRGLSFIIDEVMNQPIVKVTRDDTGEVIRQYPTEEIVRVAHSIERLKGVLFKELI